MGKTLVDIQVIKTGQNDWSAEVRGRRYTGGPEIDSGAIVKSKEKSQKALQQGNKTQ